MKESSCCGRSRSFGVSFESSWGCDILRWPGGPIIWPLFCYVFRMDFQMTFILLWIPRSWLLSLPTWSIFLASNFPLGMFFLSSFHFQCFWWIFAFHTCNFLHDFEASWIMNDFEVCINLNFYCSGYCHCHCQLFAGWWFQIFFIFTYTWGRFPFWLIFFKGVETTNQFVTRCFSICGTKNFQKHSHLGKLQENWDAQGLSDRRACLAIILAATLAQNRWVFGGG